MFGESVGLSARIAGPRAVWADRRGVRWLVALPTAVALLFVSAGAASAADRAYWANSAPTGAIRVGNLNGSASPANLGASYASESAPAGVAIDPAAGKIYWADSGTTSSNGTIRVGNLDGSGTPQNLGANYTSENHPLGVAIDPAAGKIYWADAGLTTSSGAIRVGNLDGSGTPQNLGANYTGENFPYGVAIDPAAGKIYWANSGGTAIRVGNLDGSGTPQNLGTNYNGENNPEGLAIDPAAGKIYWTAGNAIRTGNLNGSGTPQDLGTNYISESSPAGVAIDAAARRIYWTNFGSGEIRVGNLDGSGMPQKLGPSYGTEEHPGFVALLRAPVAAGAPRLSGGSTAGSTLSCSQGSWTSDLLGSFLYHAPHTYGYSWRLNGVPIARASSSTITARSGGSYVCTVTAVNQAGEATQVSAAHPVSGGTLTVRIKNKKISHKNHTAKFTFTARGASGFRCALVKVKKGKKHKKARPHFSRCSSPKTYKHLKAGKFKFEVRALNSAGKGPTTSASFRI